MKCYSPVDDPKDITTKEYVDAVLDGVTNKMRSVVTLAADGWSDKSQTVNLPGVTADNDLFVAPTEDSVTDYYNADIRASAQAEGQLTFICGTVPTSVLMANVVIFD